MTLKLFSNPISSSQLLEGTTLTSSVIALILEQGLFFAIAPLWATTGLGIINRNQLHRKLKENLEKQNTKIENLENFYQEEITTETTEIKELIQKLGKQLPNTTPETPVEKTVQATENIQRGLVNIFIDHTNLQNIAKSLQFHIDYKALLRNLQQNSPIDGAWFYTKLNSKNPKIETLYRSLETYGYQLKERRLQQKIDQQLPQTQLALELEDLASDSDTVVLVSSNYQFASLVQKLQQKGKRVEIVGIENDKNEELIATADKFTSLKEIRPHIEANSNN